MGKGNFRPPQTRHSSTDHQNICHRWLCRRPLRLCQIRSISVNGGLLGTWVKYNQNCFIYALFGNSPTGQTLRRIFTHDGSNDAASRKDVLLWEFITLLPIWGSKPQNTPIFARELAFSSQTRKIEKHAYRYYQNYCIDSNQILQSDKGHQMLFVGGPNTHITNPRQRTANILEKSNKSSYLGNGLNDRHEIWHGYANIRYDTVDLRALKSWRDGQLYLAHGQKRKIRNK